jgi:hypothetical protein
MARYRIENKNSVGSYGNGQGVEFQADTLGHAQTTAQQFATLFQVNVVLVDPNTIVNGGAVSVTAYSPGAAGSALGNQATGISY